MRRGNQGSELDWVRETQLSEVARTKNLTFCTSKNMKILDILEKRMIIPQLASQNKEGALRELVHVLAQVEKQVDEERMMETLLERESLGSTGIGEGVAIPHGKSKDVKKLLASFGRSLPGVDFQSMDGKPAHLFFLLVAPENSAGIHLKALARISRLMKDQTFRKRLMEANSVEEIYSLVAEGDEKYLGVPIKPRSA